MPRQNAFTRGTARHNYAVFKKYCEIRMITHKEGAVLVGDQSSVIDTDLTAKETT